jgi:hypothetical protein
MTTRVIRRVLSTSSRTSPALLMAETRWDLPDREKEQTNSGTSQERRKGCTEQTRRRQAGRDPTENGESERPTSGKREFSKRDGGKQRGSARPEEDSPDGGTMARHRTRTRTEKRPRTANRRRRRGRARERTRTSRTNSRDESGTQENPGLPEEQTKEGWTMGRPEKPRVSNC